MGELTDAALAGWAGAWSQRNAEAVLDRYRVDAVLLWVGVTPDSVWGHLALRDFLAVELEAASDCEASFGPTIGPDQSRCGASFLLRRDGWTYEGFGFFRVSNNGLIEIDRRYPGPR